MSAGPLGSAAVRPRQLAPSDLRERFGVFALTLLLAVAACALYTWAIEPRALPPATPHVSWFALAFLYLAAEAFVVHFTTGRETHTFSLSEIPLVLGLFLSSPGELLVGQLVGSAMALAIVRRQPLRKLSFNLASFAFSACLALIVFRAIVDPADPLGPRGWIAAFSAAIIADLASAVTVQMAIAASTGQRPPWSDLRPSGTVYVLANATLGLVTVLLLTSRPETAWLAGALTLAMFGAYRVSERERLKQQRLIGLHAATQDVAESLDKGIVAGRLVDRARHMFGAETAALLFLASQDTPARCVCATATATSETHCDSLGGWETVVTGHVVTQGTGMRIVAAQAAAPLRDELAAGGVRDLMVAPVLVGTSVGAVLAVVNREGVGSWRPEDMTLLETLANHAAIALRNGELVEGLASRAAENEYQARHDALTGLPNRTWFHALVEAALRSEQRPAALVTMDIDRFKEINDTLGHENGDRIIVELAGRLLAAAQADETVARLGGDEFAMLIRGTLAPEAARDALGRIGRCFDEPFAVGDLLLDVSASMGVALTLTDGRDAGTLLRHADVAMYRAKASHVEYEFYASDRDEHTSARLALAGELRHALDERELTPWFQPVLELATGRIVGAEALIRWQHPVRGLIMPDAFIPVVEQTNLLRPMTLFVLERAIERCATWRAMGLDLTVAVNLSARNLVDDALPDDVARMLAAAGLPGSAITLEITESAMMADPVQALETLGRLRALGARIAVDDFGTGHAALAYLKRLPVTELKIDRTFVTGLDVNEDDRSIVRSTIELAHDLGLRCVAEGVETSWTWRWLAAHRCDLAQGWLMGMAVPAAEFEDLVRRSRPGAVEPAPPARVPRRMASGDLVRRGSRRPARPRGRMP